MLNEKEQEAFAIAALVSGILSIVTCCFGWLSIVLAVLAIIFGSISLKSANRGMALAGIILGSIGILLFIMLIIGIISLASLDFLSELDI